MCGRIEAYLNKLHHQGVHVDLVEVERRLSTCRQCGSDEACPNIPPEQWLPLIATGHKDQAAELCERWKP